MQQIITNDPSSCEYAKRVISYFVQQLVLVQPAVNWVDRLNAAIGVSTALDEREQPAYQTFRLGRTTAAGVRTDDVHRHPGLKRKWKERKHSLDSIWLIRREGERGRLKEEGTERDPLIEASRPAERLTMLDCVNAAHCSCPSNSDLVCRSRSKTDSCMGGKCSITTTINDIASHSANFKEPGSLDRTASSWRTLDYARCHEKRSLFGRLGATLARTF